MENKDVEVDVFLSYDSRDQKTVLQIAAHLKAEELTVFFDRWHLTPGLPWQRALEEKLNSCRTIAVFIGAHGLGRWQHREKDLALIRQAHEPNFRVIPVLLPGSEPALDFLSAITWIDMREDFMGEEPLKLLVATIRNSTDDLTPNTDLSEAWSQLCPYRGLRPFREEDAPFFFGRAAISGLLAEMAQKHNLLGVVGASGSGKSSIVRAGLIPRLRRNNFGVVYDFISMNPTDHPLRSLAASLVPLLEPEVTEVSRLRDTAVLSDLLLGNNVTLSHLVRRVLDKQIGTDRLLILIDQWEEIYTLCFDEPLRKVFVAELLDATESSPLTVVLTVRGDFYGHVLSHRVLADRLQGGLINIGPMTKEELREAMIEPAKRVGLQFEAGLVERILKDIGQGPGNLPLLEFVLTSLWEKRSQDYLLNSSYETIGEAQGAISRWADSVLDQLNREQYYLAHQLLTQLVQIGESTEDTRRRVSLHELPEGSTDLVRLLANNRLLVTNRGEGGAETIELAHDTLIENWEKLKAWIEEDREVLLRRIHLSEARSAWERADRDPLALLAGVRLLETERLLQDRRVSLPATDQEFLRKSTLRRWRQSLLRKAAFATLVLLLISALAISYVAYGERKRAEMEAASEKEVASFLIALFETVDPAESKGKTLTAREIIDKGAKELSHKLHQKPETKATLLDSLGKVYRNLGLYDSAIELTTKGLSIRREVFGEEHPAVAESLYNLALLLDAKGDFNGAETLYRQSLAMRQKLLGETYPTTIETIASLADCLAERAKYGESEPLARKALSLQLQYLSDDKAAIASTMNTLGRTLNPRSPEAEKFLREALSIRRQLFGEDNPDVVVSMNNLATLLWARGDYKAAEPLLRRALEINRRLLGPEHPNLATSINNMGQILASQGKYDEAEPLYREALAMQRKLSGDDLGLATTLNNLSTLYYRREEYEQAEVVSREALELRRSKYGRYHPAVAEGFNNLGMIQKAAQKYEQAEANLREALEIDRRLFGTENLDVASDMANLGSLLAKQGKMAGARELVREALAIKTKLLGAEVPEVKELKAKLTAIGEDSQRP